jgi:uncharacterized membrane protein (UPF0127 family)
MRIITLTSDNNSIQAKIASSFLERFLGLMGRKSLPARHGLLLSPCNSIHMMFMRFAIDAVFLDKDNCIVKLVPQLRPWLGLAFAPGAHACIELPAGTVEALGWRVGMKLSSSEV